MSFKIKTFDFRNEGEQALRCDSGQALRCDSGQALPISLMVVTIALAAVLGMASITRQQIKIVRDIKESAVAVAAADAVAERALWSFWKDGSAPLTCNPCYGGDVALTAGSSYRVNYDFFAPPRTIQSVGLFKDSQRAFMLSGF